MPYKSICDLFVRTGAYVGGADGLFNLHRDMFNNGQRVKTSCINCISAVLIDIDTKIKEYERSL